MKYDPRHLIIELCRVEFCEVYIYCLQAPNTVDAGWFYLKK